MPAQLTLAGQPLAYDKDGKVADFLDRHQSLADLRHLCEPVSRYEEHAGSRDYVNGNWVGLPKPNYPAAPRIRLNQLYWPTGATRWAVGYFLAGTAAKTAIMEAAGASNAAVEFIASDGNETFTANLYVVSPRQITCVEGENELWLITVVDERFFWQWKNFGNTEVTSSTTWGNLIETLGTQLGVTISAETVAAAYLGPDPQQFTRRYAPAALLLDAAAHSVGRRVVRAPDGTVTLQTFSAGATAYDTNLEGDYALIAGGAGAAPAVPATVNVIAQKMVHHVPLINETYPHTLNASSYVASDVGQLSGVVKTVRTVAYGEYSGGLGSAFNSGEIETLAAAIASDYYAGLAKQYDFTFVGVKTWAPCAFDDHTLYQFGGECPKENEHGYRDRQYFTRVQSAPINFGCEFQLSQDPNMKALGHFQFGELQDDLTGDGVASVRVWEGDTANLNAQTEAQSDNYINTYAFSGQEGLDGDKVLAWWDRESRRWYSLPTAGEPEKPCIQVTLSDSDDLSAGNFGLDMDAGLCNEPVGAEVYSINNVGGNYDYIKVANGLLSPSIHRVSIETQIEGTLTGLTNVYLFAEQADEDDLATWGDIPGAGDVRMYTLMGEASVDVKDTFKCSFFWDTSDGNCLRVWLFHDGAMGELTDFDGDTFNQYQWILSINQVCFKA